MGEDEGGHTYKGELTLSGILPTGWVAGVIGRYAFARTLRVNYDQLEP